MKTAYRLKDPEFMTRHQHSQACHRPNSKGGAQRGLPLRNPRPPTFQDSNNIRALTSHSGRMRDHASALRCQAVRAS